MTFYERLGYKKVGEFKDYIINGESEILMPPTVTMRNNQKPGWIVQCYAPLQLQLYSQG